MTRLFWNRLSIFAGSEYAVFFYPKSCSRDKLFHQFSSSEEVTENGPKQNFLSTFSMFFSTDFPVSFSHLAYKLRKQTFLCLKCIGMNFRLINNFNQNRWKCSYIPSCTTIMLFVFKSKFAYKTNYIKTTTHTHYKFE